MIFKFIPIVFKHARTGMAAVSPNAQMVRPDIVGDIVNVDRDLPDFPGHVRYDARYAITSRYLHGNALPITILHNKNTGKT